MLLQIYSIVCRILLQEILKLFGAHGDRGHLATSQYPFQKVDSGFAGGSVFRRPIIKKEWTATKIANYSRRNPKFYLAQTLLFAWKHSGARGQAGQLVPMETGSVCENASKQIA